VARFLSTVGVCFGGGFGAGVEGAPVVGAKESGCCVCDAFVTAGEGSAVGEGGLATRVGGESSGTGAEYCAPGAASFGASFRPSI
jgi:hypothetical protein